MSAQGRPEAEFRIARHEATATNSELFTLFAADVCPEEYAALLAARSTHRVAQLHALGSDDPAAHGACRAALLDAEHAEQRARRMFALLYQRPDGVL